MNINYPEDYCAPSLSEQVADVDIPWEIVPAGFHRIQHYYPGKYFYVARKLDPRIVTYCAHVKGAKALNLPF